MTRKLRMPGNLEKVETRFFGQFTPKDLARIGLPTLLGFTQASGNQLTPVSLAVIGLGILTGVIWWKWQPAGQPLEELAYNGGRWFFNRSNIQGQDYEAVEDNHVLSSDGSTVGFIEVTPTNLELKTKAEQAALHSVYRELFESVTYPIKIWSRQEPLNLDAYIESLDQPVDNKRTERIRNDYVQFCEELADGSHTATHHYVIVRVDPYGQTILKDRTPDWLPLKQDANTSKETLIQELDSRCREVTEVLNAAGITAEQVTGEPLETLATQANTPNPTPGIQWTSQPYKGEFGEYQRTLYITEFPNSLELAWPLQLLRTNGLIDITQVIRPRHSAKTSKKLRQLSEKLRAEIDSFLVAGYAGTNKLESLLEDVEWILDLLATREDHTVDYAAYITVHSTNQDDCLQAFDQVCNRLQTMQIGYEQPVFRTDQAYTTASPFYTDLLDETMLLPAGSAATGFPFATQATDQDTGVIYGVDKGDGTPLLLDRFKWKSHSMARMGAAGSGKSYDAKLELLRAYLTYPQIKIIVVDPKKEYQHVVTALNGETHTVRTGETYSFEAQVTSFEPRNRGQLEDVDRLIELVQQVYTETSQDREPTLVLIDEARILMNDERGRHVLNQFILEARDTNTAVTLISQNASHFTSWRQGREILDNMPAKIFMQHERVGSDVVDYFNLSTRETQELSELKTGTDSPYSEAVIRVSRRLNTRAQIKSTEREHRIIDTEKLGTEPATRTHEKTPEPESSSKQEIPNPPKIRTDGSSQALKPGDISGITIDLDEADSDSLSREEIAYILPVLSMLTGIAGGISGILPSNISTWITGLSIAVFLGLLLIDSVIERIGGQK